MSLNTTPDPCRDDYTASSGQVAFTYTFRVINSTDIKILLDGVEQSSGFTVSGLDQPGGGTVTFTTAPGAGVQVTFMRAQPMGQSSVYQANEAFPYARLEKDIDKLAMITQMLKERLDRAIKFGETIYDYDSVMPTLVGKSGYAILVASDEESLTTGAALPTSAVSITSYMETLLDDANAAAARDTLAWDVVPTVAYADLPAAATAGKLRRVSNNIRGLFMDDGTYWRPLFGTNVVKVRDFGAVADALTVDTGAITATDTTLTITDSLFVAADVGKAIHVAGAGAAGAALRTTIASFTGVNEVELTAAAGTSVSGAARVTWGTLNNTPFDNAYSALPNTGGIIQLDGGSYLINSSWVIDLAGNGAVKPVCIQGIGAGIAGGTDIVFSAATNSTTAAIKFTDSTLAAFAYSGVKDLAVRFAGGND